MSTAAGIEPIFMLCGARSGSTLLRLLLDAHPQIACPPETNLPATAEQLAAVWSRLDDVPADLNHPNAASLPETAISKVRGAVDDMIGHYLQAHGKQRYCDKSLGTAPFADLLNRVYPNAKFVCLYRHPMDVIASGIEACPWGLNEYGFDRYVISSPGNSVLALARFWTDTTAAILAVEQHLAASCHRVRYEDLVEDPERALGGIFTFLGVTQQPGISRTSFGGRTDQSGLGDFKVWHTSGVSGRSVGKGRCVPAGMIGTPAIERMNELARQLGYLPVDESWGTPPLLRDLRNGRDGNPSRGHLARPVHEPAGPGADAKLIEGRLAGGVARVDNRFARRWPGCFTEPFTIVASGAERDRASGEYRWRVELPSQTVSRLPGNEETGSDTHWDIAGDADAWHAVLTARVNLGLALRRGDLRYCETRPGASSAADKRRLPHGGMDPEQRMRIAMLTDLLRLKP